MIGQLAQGDKPLFVSLNDNVSPISSGAVNSAVKRVAKILGLGLNISGHSLRIGGCTAAAAAGIPMEIIRVIGGWFNGAMLSYIIRASAAPALSVTQRMVLRGSSVAAFSEATSREGLPLGLRSKCSTAEARHSRAQATGTAMPAQEPAFSGSGFSEFAD